MIEPQQSGSMTLAEFASLHSLDVKQANRLAKTGRILGAQRNHSGRWLVFPPAKILEEIRAYAPRKRPAVYDDPRVKEVTRVLKLFVAKKPYSVTLTGHQILAIEQLITRECETLKRDSIREFDEFDFNSSADRGEKLQCLYSALHALFQVAKQGMQS